MTRPGGGSPVLPKGAARGPADDHAAPALDGSVILGGEPGPFAWGVLVERHPALVRA